ncbi:thioredoxin [Prolixibacter bellariivorans]|uniref:Thioredoxin n=1 Tax=Prolixibacter bellariivorans TaxID=314319 RepID=A0A5M4AYS0_9BACT|nr:thioredoxin domain-containing protein [Prolixibacter bellariivorans]GET32801.1 thioredoxin [Prolixibacter bellariivorans]
MKTDSHRPEFSNELINESSPYLLQHAHNPVNWYPWGNKALEKAKSENKLLLISIGYSACHWCHVMEHESFEDTEVADLMNRNYVCIKVDREERPDVDKIYMTAVQLLTRQGGWPLNCIALPDGRPIWGGTYFPKEQWTHYLNTIAGFYRDNRQKTVEYAEQLNQGIIQTSLALEPTDKEPITKKELDTVLKNILGDTDDEYGGSKGAPKFPMPINLSFQLQAAHLLKDEEVLRAFENTLQKMAFGGIYDQVGGGFARYSVDEIWKVPHFEKMLYDNAQLIGVYAEAFQKTGKALYRQVVYQSIEFIKREMTSPEGAFYSALDADSEGEEGRFYIWGKAELKQILGEDFPLFSDYYNVNDLGHWEEGSYILYRTQSDELFAKEKNIELTVLQNKTESWQSQLMAARNERERPGLDDKTLTSWNALMISGLVKAYRAFGENEFLNLAIQNGNFLFANQLSPEGNLLRNYKNGKSNIDGFLDDYAMLTEASIGLFEITGDSMWLTRAEQLTQTCFHRFYNEQDNLFYYSPGGAEAFITNSYETYDNVIPAANSVMANALFRLGHLLENREWIELASRMALQHKKLFMKLPGAFANWGKLLLNLANPYFEIAISGPDALTVSNKINQYYLPNTVICPGNKPSEIPLLKERFAEDKTRIYVCVNRACQLPVEDVADALAMLK